MRPRLTLIGLVVATTLAAACNATSPGTSSEPVSLATLTATQLPAGTPAVTPNAEPTVGSGGGGPGQPTPGAIDPCTLLTQQEASTIIGLTLSAGVSQVLDPDRDCRWTDGHHEVTLILTPPASDPATAQAYWDAEKAKLPSGLPWHDLTVFDRSAYASASAGGFSGSALFVIDGVYGFDLVCEFAICSEKASVGAATLIAGRLP